MKSFEFFLILLFIDLISSIEETVQINKAELCQCKGLADSTKYESNENSTKKFTQDHLANEDELGWVANLYVKYCEKYKSEFKTCESADDYSYFSFCSGVLIDGKHLLTALHCFEIFKIIKDKALDDANIYVSIGGGHDLRVNCMNDDFNRILEGFYAPLDNMVNKDIAVAFVETPFEMGNRTGIFPACFLTDYSSLLNYRDDIFIAGYGSKILDKNKLIHKNDLGIPEASYNLRVRKSIFIGNSKSDGIIETANIVTTFKSSTTNLSEHLSQSTGGDSGGAWMYMTDKPKKLYTIAIHRTRYNECDIVKPPCNSTNQYQNGISIPPYIEWIRNMTNDAICLIDPIKELSFKIKKVTTKDPIKEIPKDVKRNTTANPIKGLDAKQIKTKDPIKEIPKDVKRNTTANSIKGLDVKQVNTEDPNKEFLIDVKQVGTENSIKGLDAKQVNTEDPNKEFLIDVKQVGTEDSINKLSTDVKQVRKEEDAELININDRTERIKKLKARELQKDTDLAIDADSNTTDTKATSSETTDTTESNAKSIMNKLWMPMMSLYFFLWVFFFPS